MATFDVTIKATITKTISVEAENASSAIEAAHSSFSSECDGDEKYEEDCLLCVMAEGSTDPSNPDGVP